MQQLTVALSKQNTQIQNFGNVKKEIIIDNFSKHSRGDEVILRELIVSQQSIYWQRSSSFFHIKGPTLDSLCVAILRKVKKTALWIARCISATAGDGSVVRSKLRGAWCRYESRHFCKDSSNTTWSETEQTLKNETVKTQHLLIIHCVVISLPDTRTCHEVVRVANQGPLWWIWHAPQTPPTQQESHLLVGAYKAQNSGPPSWLGAIFVADSTGIIISSRKAFIKRTGVIFIQCKKLLIKTGSTISHQCR